MVQVKPKSVNVRPVAQPVPRAQPPQSTETTRATVRQQLQRCEICGEYLRFRSQLRPYQDAPSHLRDRHQVAQVCQECYQKCLDQCIKVMSDPTKCKQQVCGTEYRAMESARQDQQRINESVRRKLAGVVATQTSMGVRSSFWPKVPSHQPGQP